jgi:signal transduction histidine kinase/ligand-binding sensor domain-containing protein
MRAYLLYLIILFFYVALVDCYPQSNPIRFTQLKGADGFTLGKVNAIIQDKFGFLWLSDQTNRCIIRYDGAHMERFQYDSKNPNGLGGHYPECLATDSAGNIWIGFYSGEGVDKYDPITNTFTHYEHDPNNPASLINGTVSAILVDKLGNVWIGTDGGLDMLNPSTGFIKHYKNVPGDKKSLSHNIVRSIYEDKEGTIWVGTGMAFSNNLSGGLNKFEPKSGTFTQYVHDPNDSQSLIDNAVRAIYEDSKGNFWVGTRGNGLHLMNRATGTFKRMPNDPLHPEKLAIPKPLFFFSHITFIKEDAAGNLWIGTSENGVSHYDVSKNKLTHFGINSETSGAFTDNSGWWMHASTDGVVWLTTQESNVWQIDILNITIPYLSRATEGTYSLLFEEPATLWIGTNNGLIKENLRDHKIQNFQHNPQIKTSLPGNLVWNIKKDNQGSIWVATNDGLSQLNPATGIFLNYRNIQGDTTSLSNNNVYTMLPEGDSLLWVGTSDGLEQLNLRTKKFKTVLRGDYFTINKGDKNILWLGSNANDGVTRFNTITREAKKYLPGLSINSCHADKKGIFWLATPNGLYWYDASADAFLSAEELNSNLRINATIFSIVSDLNDNLWMSTTSGIVKMNDKRNLITVFSKHNGIALDSFGIPGGCIDSEGRIYFIAMRGYYLIEPEKLKRKTNTTPLYFTRFWMEGKVVNEISETPLKHTIDDTKEVNLLFDQNTFDIGFTTIDFLTSQHSRIMYMLENYDADWRLSNSENRASYFKVPPGKYTFRIKLIQNENNEAPEKSIKINIAPPWWKTSLAYGFYGCSFIFFVILIDRVQRRRIHERERARTRDRELEQAKKIEKAYQELKATQSQLIQSEKMASLGELTAGIAHEIQNPLNFVNNFSDVSNELIDEMNIELEKGDINEAKAIAKDVKQNLEKINHHGKRADAIVKGMLQHSRSSSGQKELTDINALCDEYLRLSYHGLRAKDKSFNAKFETHLDPSLPKVNVVPQDFGRVILNLINNAFYAVSEKAKLQAASYEPQVIVSTKKVGDKVEISVKDNGSGISESIKEKIFQPFFTTKPTGQGTGLGLSLSYDIVKAHGGELKVETREGTGTAFTISLVV